MKTKIILCLVWFSTISQLVYGRTAEITLDKYINCVDNTTIIPIHISNDFLVSGFQFNLILPEGLNIDCQNNDWETTSRTKGFNVSANYSDGMYKFSSYHPNGNVVSENEGIVLNVRVHSDKSLLEGAYGIKITDGFLFEDGNIDDIEVPDAFSLITIVNTGAIQPNSDFMIYSENIRLNEEETSTSLKIFLKNSEDIEAFSFDIIFPPCISPLYNEKDKDYFTYGDRAGRKDYVDVETTNGFHVINDYTWTIEEGDDEILELKINVPTNNGKYDIDFTNIAVTTSNDVTINLDDFRISLIIGSSEEEYVQLQHATPYLVNDPINDINIKYLRNFESTNWQALYVPFEMNVSEWGNLCKIAKLDEAYEDGGEIRLIWSIITSGNVEPNTPYIIKPNEIGTTIFQVHNANLAASESKTIKEGCVTLTGIYTEKKDMASSGSYVLKNGTFIPTTDDSKTLKPYHIYLNITDLTSKPNQISCFIDGEVTSLDDVFEVNKDDTYYNIQGLKTSANEKGILIRNGTKFFNK